MFEPVFQIRAFGRDPALDTAILQVLLASLSTINAQIMRRFEVPPLYTAGLVYQREPFCRYCEEWRDCEEVIRRGGGDCEDLSCYRVAELRLRGIRALPFVRAPRVVEGGVLLYHIQVLWPDGRIEDPSARLGMGKVRPHAFASHAASSARSGRGRSFPR